MLWLPNSHGIVSDQGCRINNNIEKILKGFGVKVGRQSYTYGAAGGAHSGENVYGILQAPRGDATEAIVLVCPWKTIDGSENRVGVALSLTLARYFKRELNPRPSSFLTHRALSR
jgi:glycosylphosphatidylinositol transamidase